MFTKVTKTYKFWKMHGLYLTISVILNKLGITKPKIADTFVSGRAIDVQYYSLATLPMRTYSFSEVGSQGRVNLITDSVGKGSLFGGVGTALIFAVLLANKRGCQLRVITRTESASPEVVGQVLSLYGIELENELEFKFASIYHNNYEVDINIKDIFITTSWWTTASALKSVPNDRIIYLLQEDERMFYPYGDERLCCENVLRNTKLNFVVNTKLLNDALKEDSIGSGSKQSVWFEPAFPKNIYFPRDKSNNQKKRFFFYARPNNSRNLYQLGIHVLEQAIASNLIDLNFWDIYFVGKDLYDIKLAGIYSPIKHEGLSWADYSELIGSMDVALSLMYTPHPSYPPLDLAASGAIVVTNRFANKQSLDNYSHNIIMSDLNIDSLLDSLRVAISLSHNNELRNKNFLNNGLITSWHDSFKMVLNHLDEVV